MSNEETGDHFENLFEFAPISLWEKDYSGIKQFLDDLRAEGITDLEAYLNEHPREIEESMRRMQVMRVNRATLELYGASSKEELLASLGRVFSEEMRVHFGSELLALWNGEMEGSGDGINYRLDGEPLHIRLHWRILPECEADWDCVLVTIENINALKKAEARFHNLFTHAPISLWEEDFSAIKQEFDSLRARGVTDLQTHLAADPQAVDRFMGMVRVLDVNQKTLDLFEAPDKATLLANLDKIFRDDMRNHFANELVNMWNGRAFYESESVNYSLSGASVYVQLAWTLMPGSERDFDWVLVALQDITARKKAEEHLRYLGTHDVMTGLYNRAYFEETLLHLEKNRSEPISVIIIDLNNLKPTNDQYGHQAGDKLIRRTAEVLKASLGENQLTARIGGDEFIVILPGSNLSEANDLIERIQSLVVVNNKYYREPELSLSLGAAVSSPGLSLEKVISQADDEMYRNKGIFHHRRKEDFLEGGE